MEALGKFSTRTRQLSCQAAIVCTSPGLVALLDCGERSDGYSVTFSTSSLREGLKLNQTSCCQCVSKSIELGLSLS